MKEMATTRLQGITVSRPPARSDWWRRVSPRSMIFKHPLNWLIGVAVLGLGISEMAAWFGAHVTECGVDAAGPYATIRVSSLVGGLGAVDHQSINVFFTYDGARYATTRSTTVTVKVPVLGSTTTVVRGEYPPRVINSHRDGEPEGKINVEGHMVQGRVVPDDLQKIGCSVHGPANGLQ